MFGNKCRITLRCLRGRIHPSSPQVGESLGLPQKHVWDVCMSQPCKTFGVDLPIKHDDAMYMKPHIQNHASPWPVWNWSSHLSTIIFNTNKEVAKLPELQTGLHCKVPPLYRIPLAMGSPRRLPWCGRDIPHGLWRSRVYLGSNSQIKFLQDKILKIYWKY